MKNHWARSVLFLLLAIQVSALLTWSQTVYLSSFTEKIASRSEIAKIDQMVRESKSPVLADEFIGLLPLNGKSIYYEPFEFSQLAKAGKWDPTPLTQDISAKKFSVIMIYFPSDFSITRSRWTEQFFRTIASAYDNTQTLADTLIYLPK